MLCRWSFSRTVKRVCASVGGEARGGPTYPKVIVNGNFAGTLLGLIVSD